MYFNPRSLAGATKAKWYLDRLIKISIHAPLRERRFRLKQNLQDNDFNPRSLAGATYGSWQAA